MDYIIDLAQKAKAASKPMSMLASSQKDAILFDIANAIKESSSKIIEANIIDINNAAAANKSEAMIDRLRLDEDRIKKMSDAIKEVIALPDPIGEVIGGGTRPNGLQITKIRVPLGVVGIIYEARPNVTADAIALCLKTGNAVILKGGSEAINSNKAIVDAALSVSELPQGAVSLVEDTSRKAAEKLMQLDEYLDVLIPRGGAGLIRSVVENAKVPTIQTGTGNCHIYVDETADLDMALRIIHNAKTSRPAVCNAAESLLVHEKIADKFLPMVANDLKNVELRGCERSAAFEGYKPASEEDWGLEFLDYILAVKVVSNIDEAISHIDKYGTKHSECIVTSDYISARKFRAAVDAAVVYVNASTRFTDGGEFGLGAEIGISTQKLHARGPMGLTELTSVKYLVEGDGQIR